MNRGNKPIAQAPRAESHEGEQRAFENGVRAPVVEGVTSFPYETHRCAHIASFIKGTEGVGAVSKAGESFCRGDATRGSSGRSGASQHDLFKAGAGRFFGGCSGDSRRADGIAVVDRTASRRRHGHNWRNAVFLASNEVRNIIDRSHDQFFEIVSPKSLVIPNPGRLQNILNEAVAALRNVLNKRTGGKACEVFSP